MSQETVNLDLCKKQRAAFKNQLTYFKNQCSTASTLGAYESLLRRIQLIYDSYNSVQLKLEACDDSTAGDRDSFEDDYGNLESMLITKIHELKKTDDNSAAVSFQNSSIHETSSENSVSMGIRLPELKLPSFNGSEADWLAFRDIFIDLIHNKKIATTVKFVYLISQIREGSAYSLIEHLPVTAENYDVAWKTICEKYNNEVTIKKFHMREIYEIKGPLENSSKTLQLFIDKAVKHYNALKSLKVNVAEWDLILTHHLTQKLDIASRTSVITNSKPSIVLSFTDFIHILRTRVQLLQELQFNISHQSSKTSGDIRRVATSKYRSFAVVADSNNCAYCTESHPIVQCPSFNSKKLTPKERSLFIRDKGFCTNCLIAKHRVRDCEKAPCTICSLKHHATLHYRTYQPDKNPRSAPSPTTTTSNNVTTLKQDTSSSDHVFRDDPHTSVSVASTLNSVSLNSSQLSFDQRITLLGTALVNTTASNGNKLLCRALLDSGSHMNFITAEACDWLKTKRYPTNKTISGIGDKESSIRHKIYLTVSSRVSDYSIELKFYVLPKITNDIPSFRVNFDLNTVPVDIKLADPYFIVPDRIDLLLGVEIYNQLFSGESVAICKKLPLFHNTVLGYVVCGKAERRSIMSKPTQSRALCSTQILEKEWPQPSNHQLNVDPAESETRTILVPVLNQNIDQTVTNQFQFFTKLLRVVAYILRVCQNSKHQVHRNTEPSINHQSSEIGNTLTQLIWSDKPSIFEEDITCLRNNHHSGHKISLRSIFPFLDANGSLRVNGHLDNASTISNDRNHPILLSGNHMSIVRNHRCLNTGPQSLLHYLRLRYWIISEQIVCRTLVSQCIRCCHAHPHTRSQIVSDLSIDRVTKSARTFIIVLIDFCGQLAVKQVVRFKLSIKCNTGPVVCFTNKSVHSVVVMNLSTELVIACFRRFIACHGMGNKFYSDTNFIGARSELRELKPLFSSYQFQDQTSRYCTPHHIEWLTISSQSSQFEGLCDSANEIAKYHLRRIAGASFFIYLFIYLYVFCTSEDCLILTDMSTNPSNFPIVLSSGHFQLGSPLASLMETSLLDLRIKKLLRFQLSQHHSLGFWNQCQLENVVNLQRRYTWHTGRDKHRIGVSFYFYDDELLMKWSHEQIIEAPPGI